jgi:hypothetical protein
MPKQLPGKEEKWLYTVTQVEEVKRMLGFVPIMIATIIFNTGASCCQLIAIAIQLQICSQGLSSMLSCFCRDLRTADYMRLCSSRDCCVLKDGFCCCAVYAQMSTVFVEQVNSNLPMFPPSLTWRSSMLTSLWHTRALLNAGAKNWLVSQQCCHVRHG